jgi:hypothetical protein
VLRELVAKISSMSVVTAKVAIMGWSGTENNITAQVVLAGFAVVTEAAWYTWFNGNSVTRLQVCNLSTTFDNDTCSFMTKNHWGFNNKVSNMASNQVMNIGSTDSNSGHTKEYLMFSWLWNWTLFQSEISSFVKNSSKIISSHFGSIGLRMYDVILGKLVMVCLAT